MKSKSKTEESLNDLYEQIVEKLPQPVRTYNSVEELMKGGGISKKIQKVLEKLATTELEENELDTLYNEMIDNREYFNELFDDVKYITTPKPIINGCSCCGGKQVIIRGKYPKSNPRTVCPTCLADTLDDIHTMSNPDFGIAEKENV